MYPPLLYVSCVCVCMYLFLSSLWQIENWICVFLFLSFVILFFVGVGVYGRMYMLMLYTVCMLIVWDWCLCFYSISGSIFTIVIHFILSSYHSFFPLLYVLLSFYFILVSFIFPIVIRVIFSDKCNDREDKKWKFIIDVLYVFNNYENIDRW